MELRELLEILASARDLLADKSRWSPVHIATDENGRWVPVGSSDATRFNLQGVVIRAAGRRAKDAMRAAETALRACSSETFARTLTSARPMKYADALEWLEAAVLLLAAQVGSELLTTRSGSSGLILRVSEAAAISRRTTGTGDD